MANEDSKEFLLKFTTQAETAGAEKVAGSIKHVTEETAAAAPVIRDYAEAQKDAAAAAERRAAAEGDRAQRNAEIAASPGRGHAVNDESILAVRREMEEFDKAEKAAKEEINAAEEKRNALLSTRQAIIELESEALAAEAAGDTARAAALEREVALQKLALQIRQSTVVTEEESFVIAEQQIVAMETIAATERAQIALNKELEAIETARLATDRAMTREQEKQAAARAALVRSLSSTAGSVAGISGVAGALAGGVGGLASLAALEVAIRGISAAIDAFKGDAGEAEVKQHNLATSVAETTRELRLFGLEAAPAGSRAAESLEAADKVVKEITTSMDQATEAARRFRQAEDDLADADLAERLAELDLQQQNGDITEPEARRQKAALRAQAQQDKLTAQRQEIEGTLAEKDAAAEKARQNAAERVAREQALNQQFQAEAKAFAGSGVGITDLTPAGAAAAVKQLEEAKAQAARSENIPSEELAKIDRQIEQVRELAKTYQDLEAAKKDSAEAEATASSLTLKADEAKGAAQTKLAEIAKKQQTVEKTRQTENEKARQEEGKALDKNIEDEGKKAKALEADEKKVKEGLGRIVNEKLSDAEAVIGDVLRDENDAKRDDKAADREAKKDYEARKKAFEEEQKRNRKFHPHGGRANETFDEYNERIERRERSEEEARKRNSTGFDEAFPRSADAGNAGDGPDLNGPVTAAATKTQQVTASTVAVVEAQSNALSSLVGIVAALKGDVASMQAQINNLTITT